MNLQFSVSQIIDRFNLARLSEIQQLQFLIAGRNAWGFNQPLSLLEIFANGDSQEQMAWEYYQILDADTQKPLYDAWILADDSGTVFYANSVRSTEVEMCQSYFDSVVSDETVENLAVQIQQAYRRCRQAFDDDEGGYDKQAFDTYWGSFYAKMNSTPADEADWQAWTKKLEAKLSEE
jgi:hypothetical protein